MLLSALLQYKKMLQDTRIKPASDHAYNDLFNILHIAKTSPLQFGDRTQELSDKFDKVNQSFVDFQSTMDAMIEDIDGLISAMEPAYFADSYHLYSKEMINETTEYILDRKLHQVTPEIYDFVISRVALYNSHLYPGVIIRPSKETLIQHMTGCDPLYVVDQNYDLLAPCLESFNEVYQRRIRKVIMKERSDDPLLGQEIPDNQIGFFLIYNYFNFRPFEVITKCLKEVFEKLRPGGIVAMTFNNCDLPNGVMLAERNYMCYTPGKMIEKLAESIGYEIKFRYDTHVPNTWLELKKPGEIKTLRGGQSLAKIVEKSK